MEYRNIPYMNQDLEKEEFLRNFKEEPERLLDALTTQGRILTYEIPSIINDGKYFWD